MVQGNFDGGSVELDERVPDDLKTVSLQCFGNSFILCVYIIDMYLCFIMNSCGCILWYEYPSVTIMITIQCSDQVPASVKNRELNCSELIG